jgi:pectate lyase
LTSMCNGRSIRGDRAQYQYADFIPEGHLVYESTIFTPIPTVQRCQLILGEILGHEGKEFTNWSIEEITAWAKYAYRKEDNCFIPMLTDGYSLEGFTIQKDGYFGPKGRIESPIKATDDFFWLYCLASRISKDEYIWSICRNIGLGIGIGDIGKINGKETKINTNYKLVNYKIIYALIELYKTTKKNIYIDFAFKISNNIIDKEFNKDFFCNNNIVSINNPNPLALLNLAVFIENKEEEMQSIFI